MFDEPQDKDISPQQEIDQHFNSKCSHLFSKKLSDSSYILSVSGLPDNDPNIIIGRSDRIVQIYNVSNNNLMLSVNLDTENDLIGVKACPDNKNLFFVATNNCQIMIWDIRQTGFANTFKDTTIEDGMTSKTMNCFDVSSNNLLLSGGTDLVACDAYLLFWDVRKLNLMGAYWESHTDDITQVLFNPNNMNQLISGSTDGLINIYDLSQTCEEDALIDSLNTTSSIEKLVWYNQSNKDVIGCITHTDDVQLWNLDQAFPQIVLNKESLAAAMKREIMDYAYVADIYTNPKNDDLNILSGSSYGNSECLRGFNFIKNKLKPCYDFKGNKQIVRCSWFNHNVNILLTGGENGILDLWNVENIQLNGMRNC